MTSWCQLDEELLQHISLNVNNHGSLIVNTSPINQLCTTVAVRSHGLSNTIYDSLLAICMLVFTGDWEMQMFFGDC